MASHNLRVAYHKGDASVGNKICHHKMNLWQVDYFELKRFKIQKIQKKALTFPLTA